MANRHLSRSIVMQSMFEMDFRGLPDSEASTVLERNAEEFAPGMGDFSFMKSLTQHILEKKKDIDAIIEKAAPDWPIDKISIVDRNILRIGLYELLFSDRGEVPAKVAINESIELAKTFGGETSGKFVNGVLGAVYKELGEPGKDETSKKKKDEVPDDKAPIEKLGGAVVYMKKGNQMYLAFVHDIFKHWTLSKGHVEEGQDEEQETKKEIKEEMGVDIDIKQKLGENSYITYNKEKKKIRKSVVYFLAECISPFESLKLQKLGGLDDAKWFPLEKIGELPLYDDLVPIITKAVNILLKTK
ncbi:MAG: transcription antitermination factor NusB [Candidatus Pacebacteria bacterium]|nr:transcription antitermination factor NusB [Candidatus Paceibacterota bacterium]